METSANDRLLLINKPLHWTSFDVVNRMRRILKMKKIGHAGTLDPLATGLLIVCTGKRTKQIDTFQLLEKEYTGVFVLGQTTASFDLETEVVDSGDAHSVSDDQIIEASKHFTGVIQQIPPTHSAIKVNGKRAYELARKGKEAELKSREVTIHAFQITEINLPTVRFKVVCSKGTYIRSLARDFGTFLGTGAYLRELCRTRIGNFKLEDSLTLEELALQQKQIHENLS